MSRVPATSVAPESGSLMTVTSANQFDEKSAFQNHLFFSILQAKEYHEFVYTDVPPSWKEIAWRGTDESIRARKSYNAKNRSMRIRVMPTWIHDCAQDWLTKQVIDWLLSNEITRDEQLLLHAGVGTTLEFKHGPYGGSQKEPDFFFQVNDHIIPTLAVESGWSESKDYLYDDMNLLLVGGDSSIKIVIIIKWAKLKGGCVSGIVELFKNDRNGMPRLNQSETIFPRPSTAGSQQLRIRRCELFGAAMLTGRNGDDVLYLEVEQLRVHATRALSFMNLTPA